MSGQSSDLVTRICACRRTLAGYAVVNCRGSYSEAQDSAQETIVRAWRFQSTFTETHEKSLISWLFTILLNVHRSRWRRRKTAERAALLIAADPQEVDCEGPASLHAEELSRRLSTLPESQRAAIVGILDGGTYEGVARQLRIPIGTVKSRIWRAREALGA